MLPQTTSLRACVTILKGPFDLKLVGRGILKTHLLKGRFTFELVAVQRDFDAIISAVFN